MGVLGFALFLALCSASSGEDTIYFPYVPDSVTFSTVDALRSSELANVLATMLSYTLPEPSKWQSLDPVNSFKRPNAIFVLNVLGVPPDSDINISGSKFPLENQNNVDEQYTFLALKTKERFPESTPMKLEPGEEVYSVKSEHKDLFKDIPADTDGRLEKAKEDSELGRTIKEGTFNTSNQADAIFLLELETCKLLLNAITTNKDKLNKGTPDIYWVQFRGMHGIIQEYGTDSMQAKEAVRLLEQVIMEIRSCMEAVYPNRAVVAVVLESSLPYSLNRKSRDILQSPTEAPVKNNTIGPQSPGNQAADFSNDFHVAFALTAFTSIMLILTVLGVSVGMWFMDPGRDSIIYRMTSQRKKD